MAVDEHHADRRMARVLFAVVFATYAWFFGGGGWNQNVNFDLTRALVERGTIRIEAYVANTGDFATWNGRVYSNKPPGLSLLGAIPYGIIYAIERALGIDPDDPLVLIVNMWLTTVVVCGGSGALTASLFYLYARRSVGVSPLAAAMVSLLLAFGTYLFAYASVYMVHVPNALLLFAAFILARDKPVAAGLCAGAAILCYYISAPSALILMILVNRERLWRYVAAVAPFVVVLMIYQAVAFGSPFRTSLENADPRFLQQGALFSVLVPPDPEVFWEITFGRFRGLLYLSPILIFAIAGLVVMWKRCVMRRELIAILGIVGVFVLFNVSFNGWHGGSAIGPRYILPIVPLLGIPMLFATSLYRPLWIVLGAISIVVNFVVTATNPLPSRRIADPIGSYAIPLFLTGRLPASIPTQPAWGWKLMLGTVSVNANAPDELYPFRRHAHGSAIAKWASFNVGESFAPQRRLSVLPIVVWMLGGGALLMRMARGITAER